MARNIAPGLTGVFFLDSPGFDIALWQTLEKSRAAVADTLAKISASDRDALAVRMAAANAARGVSQDIQFTCRAVSAIDPLDHGWI